MNCPFCNYEIVYRLNNNYLKCKDCKKKFSIKKYELDIKIIEYFSNNINALEVSRKLNLNYRTVKDRYNIFRKLIANYLEELYQSSIQDSSDYEEHYYFNVRQTTKAKKSLFDAINIIGFYSNKRVYTLLMPKLKKPFNTNNDNGFEKYLSWHKLHSKGAYKTPLSLFWKYLEDNLKKYKGVKEDNFFYYLKECEFKFNFLHNKQIQILKNIYFNK